MTEGPQPPLAELIAQRMRDFPPTSEDGTSFPGEQRYNAFGLPLNLEEILNLMGHAARAEAPVAHLIVAVLAREGLLEVPELDVEGAAAANEVTDDSFVSGCDAYGSYSYPLREGLIRGPDGAP